MAVMPPAFIETFGVRQHHPSRALCGHEIDRYTLCIQSWSSPDAQTSDVRGLQAVAGQATVPLRAWSPPVGRNAVARDSNDQARQAEGPPAEPGKVHHDTGLWDTNGCDRAGASVSCVTKRYRSSPCECGIPDAANTSTIGTDDPPRSPPARPTRGWWQTK